MKPLKQVTGQYTGVPSFIAAAGFLFLNVQQSSLISNFIYSFGAAGNPALQSVAGPPMFQDKIANKYPSIMTLKVTVTTGSTSSVTNSQGSTYSDGQTMGNSYSKTQSLSFSPPKIHMTKSSSHTSGSENSQTWGYSSTQQTSWTQTTSLMQSITWSNAALLAYGNIYYAVTSQYYGQLSGVPFQGTNTLTFYPCTTQLCVATGVNQAFYPVLNQTVSGNFNGEYYSEASLVSTRARRSWSMC